MNINAMLVRQAAKKLRSSEIKKQLGKRAPSLRAAENSYTRELLRAVRMINERSKEYLHPFIDARFDADDPFESMIGGLRKVVFDTAAEINFPRIVQNSASQIDAVKTRKYEAGIYGKLKINAYTDVEKLNALSSNWVEQNVSLVTNMIDSQVSSLERVFRASAFSGTRAKDFESEVLAILNSSPGSKTGAGAMAKRAQLIAIDQTHKLGGELDRLKQTEAGIEGYYWRSSRDERVRAEHAAREGQYFRWDAPPADGHPGQPIRCRCDAEPAIDKLLGYEEEVEAIETENIKFRKQAEAKSRAFQVWKKRAA